MRWDKDKLQGLSENLDFTLNESIYRNAFPISLDRIDICNASLSDGFSTQFIKQLLNGANVDAEIQAIDEYAHKFHHLYTEQINQNKEKGTHHLSFGYPLFIHKEEFTLFPVAAPFFIWNLELEPSPNRMNTWSLKRSPQNSIKPNRFLINYLKNNLDIDIGKAANELIDGGLSAEKLSAFCNNISIQLDIPGNTSSHAIIASPSQEVVSNLDASPIIHFSGTLGMYNQNHLLLAEYLRGKAEFAEDIPSLMDDPVPNNFTHPFSLVKPDPCQKNITLQVVENALTVVEGGPGTGKTYTAAHVASNALANGNTTLIISSSKSSLENIHTTLNSNQVGGLSYLFKDENKDISPFFYALRQLAVQKGMKTNKDEELAFKILLERVLGKHDKIDSHHQLMNKQAFGTFDFTDTVGHFIESSRFAGKDVLSGRLNAREYKFTFREYDILKTDITKGEKLYSEINRLDHPLKVLHEELFSEKEVDKSEAFVIEQLIHFRAKTEELLRRFTEGLESYRDNLKDHYENHAKEVHEKYQEIKHKIGEYAQVFGEDFKRSSSTKVQMFGVFSDTYYNIKEAKNEINNDFAELEELYNEKRYFNYKFPKKKEIDTIQNIQKYLKDFGETLMDWTDNIPLGVRQESDALNSKSVQIQLDYKSRIGELEYLHDVLLEELNQIKLFKEWFSYDGITLNKRMHSLEELWELINNTQRNMIDFKSFFPWQKHWLETLPITKETIKALVKSHSSNWLTAFNSWYFYNCLSDRSFLSASVNDDFKEKYLDELIHLRNQLPKNIQTIWSNKKTLALEQLKKRDKKLYQLLAAKKSTLPSNVSLKDLFKTFSKELATCFPIMMMTPDVAEELLLNSTIDFDLVIFDDAHLVSTMQAIPITDKAERILAIGDRQQSVNEGYEIFLDTLIESGSGVTPLYYKHKRHEVACNDFINYTSYHKGIKNINYYTSPYQRQGITISLSEGSRYDEENQNNNLEAEHLVRILAEIPQKDDGSASHTAIVTSTLSQRDHISAYLLYLKQKRNPYSDKIIKLEDAGLRVLHFPEIKNHYDTIIWSLTYGTTNLRGNITQHFNNMESTFGQTALNIILGHTLKSLIVCSSIPKNYVDEQMEKDSNACGPVIKFLKYAAITASMDDEKRKAFLEEIEWPGIKKNESDMNKFMAQVKKELEPYFEQNRIKLLSPLSEIGTAAITIIPLDYKQPIPLIIGDALDRNMPTVANEFERDVYKKLSEAGYKIFKTNSLNWWKNPKKEARMLASRLIKADNTPAELEKV